MSLPVPFGLWGGGQCSFLIFCFNLDCETLSYQEAVRWGFTKARMLEEHMAVNRICVLTGTISSPASGCGEAAPSLNLQLSGTTLGGCEV